jgi:hypothetical protein
MQDNQNGLQIGTSAAYDSKKTNSDNLCFAECQPSMI